MFFPAVDQLGIGARFPSEANLLFALAQSLLERVELVFDFVRREAIGGFRASWLCHRASLTSTDVVVPRHVRRDSPGHDGDYNNVRVCVKVPVLNEREGNGPTFHSATSSKQATLQ